MFKRTLVAASLAVAALASAQSNAAVVGGGSTLAEKLYGNASVTGILSVTPLPGFANFTGVGSGNGKAAFFNHDATKINQTAGITVDYAGSDSAVTAAELAGYNAADKAAYGPLIQIPSAGTSVTIPYFISGKTSLSLTSAQLAQIFSGQVSNWNQVGGPNKAITVVYRSDSSGTTDILTTRLNFVDASHVARNSTFATAVGFNPATSAPAGTSYVAVASSSAMASTVAATDGAIGYVGPDAVAFSDATKVASIDTYLPTQVNVSASLGSIAPPSTADTKANPTNWAPTFSNPSTGYPIVGYTNLIFSQCYKDAGDNVKVRSFLDKHYTGTNDTAVTNHSMIPLTAAWQTAIHDTFWTNTSSLSVGYSNVCSGIGRPQ